MYKLSTFLSQSDSGYTAVPLFGPADAVFEKQASVNLLPSVLDYIADLRPIPGAQYVLVNAMGAGEYYGSNINGDHFEEAGLIHEPPGWTGSPLLDKGAGKKWTYGYPTFYNAYPYAHHKNKDPSRAYGEVELAVWNDRMKRVELVCRVDHDKCQRFGGVPVWDKLKAGQYPDVSMGSKVCYDLSSITTDWELYREALAKHNPKKYPYPGLAVLDFHKKLKAKNGVGIRGLSITRKDYDEWTRNHMNQILPCGRKVFVYNPYPRFFDISFVFIGADRTAKTMVFIVRCGDTRYVPSAEAGEKISAAPYMEDQGDYAMAKAASVQDAILKQALGAKSAESKKSEIKKDVVPPHATGQAVPLVAKGEKDIPEWALKALSSYPAENALSTTGAMGIVLKPREFQRITLIRLGKKDLADDLDREGKVFPGVEDTEPCPMSAASFLAPLARLLHSLVGQRSALAPCLEGRLLVAKEDDSKPTTSHNTEELRKIGAYYNGYRKALIDMVATAQDLLPALAPADASVGKLAAAPAERLFTPFSVAYLQKAFLDELSADTSIGENP